MKTFTTEELLTRMQNIVNRTLTSYKTDFTEYDIAKINEIAEQNEDIKFIWVARQMGTHIVLEDEDDYLKAIRLNFGGRDDDYKYKEYDVELQKGKWTIKKRKLDYREMR